MDVTILRMGASGDGIAEGPLYVARTLPGERIAATSVSRDRA